MDWKPGSTWLKVCRDFKKFLKTSQKSTPTKNISSIKKTNLRDMLFIIQGIVQIISMQ